ncbi:hypothetical protein [Bacteroides sp. 224]|uniref:hypothetical protein n=1 Tax=Bacteroides sp. 224 TaxID=2302936 RepID=UPI0013D04B98|nr:hypothetical protein [Bacteroides sp. 224]NDV67011.1 hypothetical protein [Bacteroides sp. 224]
MKVNFKYAMMTIAALTMGLTSCSNDNDKVAESEPQYLSIKISGVVQSPTRAVEAPGETTVNTIKLNDGHIFVINPLGQVTYQEALNVSQATNAGQILTTAIPADSRIYVIGNIPTADNATITALTDFNAIKAATSALTTQTNYKEAALANADGQPTAIIPGASNTATVNVSIKPLISRLELTQVKGIGDITNFTVKGVYVDDYYPQFTYAGLYAGTKFSQGQSTTFAGIGDAGAWAHTSLVAAPATGNVWAHNLAAGGLPRFIIELEDVKYNPGISAGAPLGEVDLSGTTYYLTVTGYNNGGLTAFERGKIYRIGGNNGIEFDQDDLGLVPNPVDVDLTLNVTILEWEVVTPTANL